MNILLFFFLIIQLLLSSVMLPTVSDTTAPFVGKINFTTETAEDPNMLLGIISVQVTDTAGIESVTMYYRKHRGSRDYRLAGKMKNQDGMYVLWSTPFHKSQYDVRFIAIDNYGNATCTVTTLALCPGSIIWVK